MHKYTVWKIQGLLNATKVVCLVTSVVLRSLFLVGEKVSVHENEHEKNF